LSSHRRTLPQFVERKRFLLPWIEISPTQR
jgi:hypothetical protein